MRFQRRDGVRGVSAITCYSSAMGPSRRARAVVRALAWTSSMLAAAIVAAQTPGVHPISGRRFAPVMGYQGADWLERAEREDEEAPDVALNVLKIAKGSAVAPPRPRPRRLTPKLAGRVRTSR